MKKGVQERSAQRTLGAVDESFKKEEETAPDPRKPLARKFGTPPFTVLDSAGGVWQDRKSAWLGLGIQSELGRDAVLMDDSKSSIYNGNSQWLGYRGAKTEAADQGKTSSTSVFDPVLAELMYGWFCPKGGAILDPFAGGSVRGIVAAELGHLYTGLDLSASQVAANIKQGEDILKEPYRAAWICGDSTKAASYPDGPPGGYDMVFSCPPYGDLEVYSDDPADISNKPYAEFMAALSEAIRLACSRLKQDRFAVMVVGDFRDKRGNLRGFPGHVTDAFLKAGLSYYNDGILVTSRGSLGPRTSYLFPRGRKLGRCHQEVLVFIKGDCKAATVACRRAHEIEAATAALPVGISEADA